MNNEVQEIEGIKFKDGYAREEIAKIKEKTAHIVNKKYIFIGDSYADGYTTEGIVESWITKTANILGLIQNENYFKNHLGGTGFVNAIDNKTFTTLLTDLEIEDKKSITDIVVLGGFNDKQYTTEQVISGIELFVNTAKTNYPNAEIRIGEIGWSPNYNNRKQIQEMICNAYSKIPSMKANLINNIQFATHNYNWTNDDYGHPNNEGQKSIANCLVSYLKTGKCDVDMYCDYSIGGNNKIKIHLHNENVFLVAPTLNIGITGNTLGRSDLLLFNLPEIIKGMNDEDNLKIYKHSVLACSDGYYDGHLELYIKNGGLYGCLFEVNSNNNNYNERNNVNAAQILFGTEVLSSYDL